MKDFKIWPWLVAGLAILTASVLLLPEGNGRLAGFGAAVVIGVGVPLVGGAIVRKNRGE